jgi:hypothetical protein
MDANQRVSYQNSQNTAAMIEAMGMQAENSQRLSQGEAIAYNDNAFLDLIEKYGLGSNTVMHFLVMD